MYINFRQEGHDLLLKLTFTIIWQERLNKYTCFKVIVTMINHQSYTWYISNFRRSLILFMEEESK